MGLLVVRYVSLTIIVSTFIVGIVLAIMFLYETKDTVLVGTIDTVPVGIITLFTGRNIPPKYKSCNGEVLRIDDYPLLYKTIGGYYNDESVNGMTKFKLPSLEAEHPSTYIIKAE